MSDLDLAREVVRLACSQGATAAECTIASGQEFTVDVRLGEIEKLKEAGSRGAGIRILRGQHVGSSYTSDLTQDGLQRMVQQAIELSQITTEDPFAGLPDPEDLGQLDTDLQLYSDAINSFDTPARIALAKEAEKAAMSADPRITNSEGAAFRAHQSHQAFANSLDFAGEYRTASCSISVTPVGRHGDRMERDFWFSLGRTPADLEPAEAVGRQAAERVLRRLGARKVPTQKVPVIFEPRTARSLLAHLFEAFSGSSVYRQESFLAGKIGEQIATDALTLVDDATLPGLFGTSPFDDEGVRSRRTLVIEKGVLRNYLLNTYTARKLNMKTTGNASRGITGNAGVGHGNLFVEPGTQSPEELIKSIPNGFYVTELIGQGFNVVTGDYSRGAAGLWIENGELTYPVSEVTIASTLPEMFAHLTLANDLEFRGSTAAPTMLVEEMTVSGQ